MTDKAVLGTKMVIGPLLLPRVMSLEPLSGGLFHDFGRGLVQSDCRLLDLPNDLGIERRQELTLIAGWGFSALF
jgi:hypothetical protein